MPRKRRLSSGPSTSGSSTSHDSRIVLDGSKVSKFDLRARARDRGPGRERRKKPKPTRGNAKKMTIEAANTARPILRFLRGSVGSPGRAPSSTPVHWPLPAAHFLPRLLTLLQISPQMKDDQPECERNNVEQEHGGKAHPGFITAPRRLAKRTTYRVGKVSRDMALKELAHHHDHGEATVDSSHSPV